MLFLFLFVSTVATALGQNPICPMCSLGPPGFGISPLNQGIPAPLPSIVETAPTFSSYSRNNPLSMYQGNPALFGTELGRAIAQRIQQLYAQGGAQRVNSGSSNYASYPESTQQRPQTTAPSYGMEYATSQADTQQAEYSVPSPPARGGCPYCFGGGNSNYGTNMGYGSGSGGYAASPARPRRVEFVKRQKQT